MLRLDDHPSGRHFLQIPGPTNVPDRVLRAVDHPTIDHRGPEFARLTLAILDGLRKIFQTAGPVIIYPASGTGAWEAALVNTLSPGDRVLMFETGHFATLWRKMADRLSLEVDFVGGDWRSGVDPAVVEAKLLADRAHAIKAVMVVHNETSTGVTTRIAEVRRAIDRARHPALFMVDTISSLASMDYRHAEWGVDVTVAGSQKGLMLPPGLSFNAVSDKALAASRTARLPRSYWSWDEIIASNRDGYFPYTPATNLLYGLHEAIDMLLAEGLPAVFARHHRHGEATRRAVRAWGLELLCRDPAEFSDSLTAVVMPEGHNADAFRRKVLERFDLSLGTGLGRLAGRVFRIGHLGFFNDLTLCGTLCGVEMGFDVSGVPHRPGGIEAALEYLQGSAAAQESRREPATTLP
ncbi:MAG TPA: aminotransferase class V-fold PLP-dependent enzyme [Casimicrobiaceae bacterium]|jgi:alanine-glyoxylate transaminase/serine-glyoxylate transaminase/serine-pyruvate transaminase|nr:aminotransferase class V-fold PLP-dependent enzyme [Casimicrobiaceae bacterium]